MASSCMGLIASRRSCSTGPRRELRNLGSRFAAARNRTPCDVTLVGSAHGGDLEAMTVERTALLVMDVQQAIVDRTIKDPDYLTRLSGAIDRARRADIRVVYVRVGFRPDHPELSPRNRIFANMTHLDQFDESSPTTQIVPAIAPQSGDIIVTKRRVSAFTGSDLEVVLRAND